MIRVILFEDGKNFTDMLSLYFEDSDKVFLTAAFSDANHAMKHIKELSPDVVLMDIEMPGKSGLDALQEINQASPDTKVMIQTQFEDEHKIFIALCRGAWGYALKTDPLEKIESAIVEVHNGGGYFSPAIANKVASFFRNTEVQTNAEYVDLTRREKEVLNYMATEPGWTYDTIAFEMELSFHTVHGYAKSIYQKLHVNCRGEAIQKAINLRLIP